MKTISLEAGTFCVAMFCWYKVVFFFKKKSPSTSSFKVLRSWWNPILETHRSPPRRTSTTLSSSWTRWASPCAHTQLDADRWGVDVADVVFCRRQYSLKLDLLEATHYKLSEALAGLNGTTTKSFHRFRDSIVKWKDKVRTHLVWRVPASFVDWPGTIGRCFEKRKKEIKFLQVLKWKRCLRWDKRWKNFCFSLHSPR